jgi:ABC-type uncharacterized transport system fused permease/ATPase subunit
MDKFDEEEKHERLRASNQEKLDEMYEMIKENNEILRSLLRRERFATAIRIAYWLIVIGVVGGAFYFIKPYAQTVMSNVSSLQNAINSLNGVTTSMPEINAFKAFLESVKNLKN